MTNETVEAVDTPTDAENFLAANIIFIMSAIGLCAYTLVLTAILRNFKAFKNSFYPLIVSLGFSDCIMLCLFLFYAVPCTILQRYPLGIRFDVFMGFVCNFSFYSSLPCIVSIAFNRYWAVCRYNTYAKVFNKRTVRMNIAFVWLFGALSSLPQLTPCCNLRYYYDAYSFAYDIEQFGAAVYGNWERSVVVLTGMSLVVSYSFILSKQRAATKKAAGGGDAAGKTDQHWTAQRRQVERQRSEFRLAIQFLFIGVYLVFFDFVFTILPNYSLYRWHLFIISILYVGNCCLNPFIYLTLNKQVRLQVRAMLLGSGTGSVVGVTGANQTGFNQTGANPTRGIGGASINARFSLRSQPQPPPVAFIEVGATGAN